MIFSFSRAAIRHHTMPPHGSQATPKVIAYARGSAARTLDTNLLGLLAISLNSRLC